MSSILADNQASSCESLAVFLQTLLAENRALARRSTIVSDNFWGLSKEDAESFLPMASSSHQRMSDSSMPGLRRWESQCQIFGREPTTPEDATKNIHSSPSIPQRRASDDDIFLVDDDDDDDEESDLDNSNDYDEEEEKERVSMDTLGELDQCLSRNVPAFSSRRRRRRYGLSYPVSSPSEDPLASVLSQGGALLDNAVMVLENIDREISMQELLIANPGLANNGRRSDKSDKKKTQRDSLPCCAKRRPSPQLEKTLSLIDLTPARAKRRPSPEFEQCLVDVISKSVSSPGSSQ